jgi:hypothetical protein
MRMGRTALLPVALLALCVLPVATAAPWGWGLLLVPVVVAVWVLRAGVDVGPDGVTAHSLLASRRVPWAEVAGIRVGERAQLWLVTTADTEVRLPVLRARDLPWLGSASGGRFPVPPTPPPSP